MDPTTATVDESAECVALTPRRPSFVPRDCSYQPVAPLACDDSPMPPLKVWSPNLNVLTGQPMRLRVSDGEISWDQPGSLSLQHLSVRRRRGVRDRHSGAGTSGRAPAATQLLHRDDG
jgi:hypothetical protein